MASVVKVAFGWLIFASLTPRIGRDNRDFGNCSGRGARRFSGSDRSHDRMSSVATGADNLSESCHSKSPRCAQALGVSLIFIVQITL